MTSLSGQTMANPTGAQVVNGSVQINAIANQLNIHNSNGAIINWQNFSIGQQEITRFIQQNSTSAVLNRVVGQNPSAIMGQLLSNGHVFLLNPNGVVFGANAVVDTAGLVASSLNMSDESFLSGKYKFSGDASNGAVINRGLITSGKGGEIVLIAPTVENHGVISVEGGRILLAAGQKMTLSSLDLEGIEFEVQAPTNTAMNLGKLLASGGSVGVFAGSLTNTGVIHANSVTKGKDGKLWLEASDSATIGGKLSAPDITIAGSDITLKDAEINASSEAGGGQVRIGGDYQGTRLGPNVSNAKSVNIDSATTISASAQSLGDGGRVIVWSDENTVVNGHISATGGSQRGNGGFVETSGKRQLDFTTPVDVSATNGKAGTWLIDPEDITIDESKASSIETALNAGSNVEVKTSDSGEGEGNITVASAITKSEGDDATLSLDAHNKIDVNAPITSTSNKLDVKLTAGNQVNVNSSITTNGGSVATLITGTSATAETVSGQPTTDTVADTTSEPATEVTTETASNEPAPETVPETETADAVVVASIDPEAIDGTPTVGEDLADLNTTIMGSIETSGGDISIDAGDTGSVLVEGTLDASNLETGETGGNIEVLGDQVKLAGDALLDASGDAGGGTIKVGGDYQGQGETPTATNTNVGEDVVIKADAVTEGDGGNIFVWSDDTTVFHGTISATGGEAGGDGGFAEVSGKQHLLMTGHANLHAANGATGTLLLDPGSVDIEAGAAGPSAPMDTFYNDWITLQLDGNGVVSDPNEFGSNLIISTADSTNGATEDISVNAGIEWASNNALTFDAGNDINIFANIIGNNGSLNLNAGSDVLIQLSNSGRYDDGVNASTITINATNLYVHGGNADNENTRISSSIMNINLDGNFEIIAGSSDDSRAIVTSLDAMTVNLDGNLRLLGGGDDSFARLAAVEGPLTIQGKSSSRAGAVEVIAGTGINNEGGGSDALITADGELVIKSSSLLVKAEVGRASVSSDSNMEITTGKMDVLAGGRSNSTAKVVSYGGLQTIDVDNDLTIVGGFGNNASAEIYQASNNDQIITVGGDLTLQAGDIDDGGNAFAQIYNDSSTDINTTVTVGGDLQVLGGTEFSGGDNFAAIANYGSATTPQAGTLTVNVGGTTLLRGGVGDDDVAALSAFTTMTLNSLGDVTLEGGSGFDADAFIAGATSPGSLNTIYLNAGDPNNPAVLNFLGNSYLIDGGGAGNIFINVSGCNPAGSCTTASPTIQAGTLSANFYDTATPVIPPVTPGTPGAIAPPVIPPVLTPIVNFLNPAISQVLAMNEEAYDEMKEDKEALDEFEVALMCN